MEETVTGLLGAIKETFGCGEQDIRAYSPLTLAYIGDVVYDLIIRSAVVAKANRPVNALHKKTTAYVKAQAQAQMILALTEELTEEEAAVYKRGRNAKPYSKAKNATTGEYLQATGFEALIGYLYLDGRTERMLYLVKRGMELTGMEI